jgi:hypothetical protein
MERGASPPVLSALNCKQMAGEDARRPTYRRCGNLSRSRGAPTERRVLALVPGHLSPYLLSTKCWDLCRNRLALGATLFVILHRSPTRYEWPRS